MALDLTLTSCPVSSFAPRKDVLSRSERRQSEYHWAGALSLVATLTEHYSGTE